MDPYDASDASTAAAPARSGAVRALLSGTRFVLCFVLSLLLLFGPAAQAATEAAPAEPAAATVAEAELRVNNRVIMTFRAPLYGVAPVDRARRARARILEQLSLKGEHGVTLQPTPLGELVLIDGAASFAVVPGDIDQPKQTPHELAGQAAQVLRLVVAEAHERRDFGALGWAALYAALATAALAAVLWLLRQGLRRLLSWAVASAQRSRHLERFGTTGRLLRERVGPAVNWLLRALHALVVLALVYAWLAYVTGQFALTRAWSERLHLFLFDTLLELGDGIVSALPNLFTALVIFLLARVVVRGVDGVFARVQSGQLVLGWLDPDLARPTRRIASTAIWLFALAMAYPYLPGAHTEAFKGVSVLVGVMLSLGASNLVGQAASGLILTYSRVIRVGEYVRIADNEGTVLEISVFTTRVRTGLGEELTLPNSLILGNVTTNYSRAVKGHGYVVDTTVTIGYDTAWRQVRAMLVEAALRTPGVLKDPAPHVFQVALSDYYPEYRLVCQAVPAEPRPRAEVLNQLHANIQDVFAENGVQIMSPNYRGDPAEPKVPPLPAPGATA